MKLLHDAMLSSTSTVFIIALKVYYITMLRIEADICSARIMYHILKLNDNDVGAFNVEEWTRPLTSPTLSAGTVSMNLYSVISNDFNHSNSTLT